MSPGRQGDETSGRDTERRRTSPGALERAPGMLAVDGEADFLTEGELEVVAVRVGEHGPVAYGRS